MSIITAGVRRRKYLLSATINIPVYYQYLFLASISILIFSNTFQADFVFDDSQAIVSNLDVIGGDIWSTDVFFHDYWGNPILSAGSHKSYRPITTLLFRLNYLIGGLNPSGYHIVNVLLHTIVTCLVLKIQHILGIDEVSSLISSLLFAIHPIHCDSVSSIVGRADILSCIFLLSAIISYHSNYNPCCLLIFACLSLFSKETGIFLFPLLIVYNIIFSKQIFSHRWKHIRFFAVSAILLAFFRYFINGFQSPNFSSSDNPAAHHPSIYVRFLTFSFLPIFHLNLLVFPSQLCFDWSMDSIPLVENITDRRFLFAILIYSILIVTFIVLINKLNLLQVLKDGKKPESIRSPDHNANYIDTQQKKTTENTAASILLFSLCLIIFPHLISSNLFSYVGFMAAERILYLPSVGYCILIAVIINYIKKEMNSLLLMGVVISILFLHANRTYNRNADWNTEESLYRSAVDINPTKAYANLGRIYAQKGNFKQAELSYKQALSHRYNMADTWYNLGVLYKDNKQWKDAMECYSMAIKIRKTFALAHLNMGLLLWESGRKDEAVQRFSQCFHMNGNRLKRLNEHEMTRISCAYNMARILIHNGKIQETIEILTKVLLISLTKTHTSYSSILNTIGEAYGLIGNDSKAEEYFYQAIQNNPNHIPAYITMANLRIRQNRSSDAYDIYSRAASIDPSSPILLYHTAIAKLKHNKNESIRLLLTALEINSNHTESLSALASIYKEEGKLKDSEKLFHHLSIISPTVQSIGNYGAILHLNGKLKEAESEYLKALSIQPDDSLTKQNLQKLRRKLLSLNRD